MDHTTKGRLRGKVRVVTGVAGDIGRPVALRPAAEGGKLACVDRVCTAALARVRAGRSPGRRRVARDRRPDTDHRRRRRRRLKARIPL